MAIVGMGFSWERDNMLLDFLAQDLYLMYVFVQSNQIAVSLTGKGCSSRLTIEHNSRIIHATKENTGV